MVAAALPFVVAATVARQASGSRAIVRAVVYDCALVLRDLCVVTRIVCALRDYARAVVRGQPAHPLTRLFPFYNDMCYHTYNIYYNHKEDV